MSAAPPYNRRKASGPGGARTDERGIGSCLVAQRRAPSREGVVRRGTVGSPHHCEVLPDYHPCPINWHAQLGLYPRVSGHKATMGLTDHMAPPLNQMRKFPAPGTHLQVTGCG